MIGVRIEKKARSRSQDSETPSDGSIEDIDEARPRRPSYPTGSAANSSTELMKRNSAFASYSSEKSGRSSPDWTPRSTPLGRLEEETDRQLQLQVPELARVEEGSRMSHSSSDHSLDRPIYGGNINRSGERDWGRPDAA